MIDLRTVLSTSATVAVQAHWDPIENTANNLQWATEEKFNRAKAQWQEPVDMTWEQWLKLFNPGPAQPLKHYSTTDFQVFLPPSIANVGDVWDLDRKRILPFLRQFHPGATMNLRHGQNGAKACLRAISPEYADIVFRIHAYFILDASIGARFRPAQFAGHLVINRKRGTICQWTLSLPPRNSEVIGVNLDTNETKLRDYLEENQIPWRQIFTGQERQSPLAQQYDIRSIPVRWLIDRDGNLIAYEANHKLMSRKGREPSLDRLVAAAVSDKPKNQ